MKRTKKETPPEPVDESPVGQETPQTDIAAKGEEVSGSLADLELAAAPTLDPDAPQTEAEKEMLGDDPPQTAPETPTEATQKGKKAPVSQTGSEPPVEVLDESTPAEEKPPMPQTDLAGGEILEDRVILPADPGDETTPPQTDVKEPVDDVGEDPASADADQAQPQKLRLPKGGPHVVSIDAERTVETDVDRLRNDLLDIVESMKAKKILTGKIEGVERRPGGPEMIYAVTYHGNFKVIIPVLDAVEEPEDYRGQPKGDVLHYLLNKRMGAEIDYVITRIDQFEEVVAASRLEAMALKRREYYFRTDREGNYQIYEGVRAEARVVSVIRQGIFVDLFGVECYIPLRELSYQRWVDASLHYQPGQRVLVKVMELDRSDRDHPRVVASVKQAGENPYEKALRKFEVGNRYVGTVSMVDLTGVFVSLDGGIDCLCTYPPRGRPPRGCRVTVRILGIDYEANRIWGIITHMSAAR